MLEEDSEKVSDTPVLEVVKEEAVEEEEEEEEEEVEVA